MMKWMALEMADLEVRHQKNKYSEIPIWEKLNLTIEEAAMYSNIGENKLRKLVENANCPFVIFNGNKRIIKRKEFEEWNSKQYTI